MPRPGVREFGGRLLRVDLSKRQLGEEEVASSVLRTYIGGAGLGASFLYQEVPPPAGWADADNLLVLASGPLGGARLAGAGSFSVVTVGPLTNGSTSSQANGYFGAYLRFSGYDGVLVRGIAEDWTYLYMHDGVAELRDARRLLGLDTWETEDAIKTELGKGARDLSVFGIGPAGENQVKFAAIVGDKGHVAAHNGVGAVMGSKRLKAVVAARGSASVPIADKARFSSLAKKMIEQVKTDPRYSMTFNFGTSRLFPGHAAAGVLPVKNLTTNIFPDAEKFSGEYYRPRNEMKPHPCWACPMHHCHIMTVSEGPYAGYVGEEPEYECWAAFSSLIGQSDLGAAVMLSDVTDRLGFDANETGWLLAVMEQFMTPTAQLADYVLPAAHWLEKPSLNTFLGWADWAVAGEAALPLQYEHRSDFDFFRELGLRLGQAEYWPPTLEDLWDQCLEPEGLTFRELMARKEHWIAPPPRYQRHEEADPASGDLRGFGTATGKVELFSTILESLGYSPLPEYQEPAETPYSRPDLARDFPLVLTTGGTNLYHTHQDHRQIASLRRRVPDPLVEIHPDTASRLGITEGDWAYIETVRGKVCQRVSLTPGIDPRVVNADRWWYPEEPGEEPSLHGFWIANINVCTDDELDHCDPLYGSWPMRGLLCRLARAPAPKNSLDVS